MHTYKYFHFDNYIASNCDHISHGKQIIILSGLSGIGKSKMINDTCENRKNKYFIIRLFEDMVAQYDILHSEESKLENNIYKNIWAILLKNWKYELDLQASIYRFVNQIRINRLLDFNWFDPAFELRSDQSKFIASSLMKESSIKEVVSWGLIFWLKEHNKDKLMFVFDDVKNLNIKIITSFVEAISNICDKLLILDSNIHICAIISIDTHYARKITAEHVEVIPVNVNQNAGSVLKRRLMKSVKMSPENEKTIEYLIDQYYDILLRLCNLNMTETWDELIKIINSFLLKSSYFHAKTDKHALLVNSIHCLAYNNHSTYIPEETVIKNLFVNNIIFGDLFLLKFKIIHLLLNNANIMDENKVIETIKSYFEIKEGFIRDTIQNMINDLLLTRIFDLIKPSENEEAIIWKKPVNRLSVMPRAQVLLELLDNQSILLCLYSAIMNNENDPQPNGGGPRHKEFLLNLKLLEDTILLEERQISNIKNKEQLVQYQKDYGNYCFVSSSIYRGLESDYFSYYKQLIFRENLLWSSDISFAMNASNEIELIMLKLKDRINNLNRF